MPYQIGPMVGQEQWKMEGRCAFVLEKGEKGAARIDNEMGQSSRSKKAEKKV